jgi:hypothetical protein
MSDQTLRTLEQLFGKGNAWETNASTKGGRNPSGLPTGFPDYLVRHSGARMGHVELKSVKSASAAAVRPEQEAFLDFAEIRGCFCAVVFEECPGQVARAWESWIINSVRGDRPNGYSWRYKYAINLAEAKRVAKVRRGKP